MDNTDNLWLEYKKTKNTDIKEKLILKYAGLIKPVIGRMTAYKHARADYEDMASAGMFGLIDAIDKFDYEKGIKFETYASIRIKGSVLDSLRRLDWVPRTLRQKKEPVMALVSYDDPNIQGEESLLPDESVTPEDAVEQKETNEILASAVSHLNERERRVIGLYYYEDMTLKEISGLMGVSESRISQIHTKAVKKLRVKLKRAKVLY